MKIDKPKGYVSHRIVYDTNAILIINLDYTLFQAQKVLGYSTQEFKVEDKGDYLEVTEI